MVTTSFVSIFSMVVALRILIYVARLYTGRASCPKRISPRRRRKRNNAQPMTNIMSNRPCLKISMRMLRGLGNNSNSRSQRSNVSRARFHVKRVSMGANRRWSTRSMKKSIGCRPRNNTRCSSIQGLLNSNNRRSKGATASSGRGKRRGRRASMINSLPMCKALIFRSPSNVRNGFSITNRLSGNVGRR